MYLIILLNCIEISHYDSRISFAVTDDCPEPLSVFSVGECLGRIQIQIVSGDGKCIKYPNVQVHTYIHISIIMVK